MSLAQWLAVLACTLLFSNCSNPVLAETIFGSNLIINGYAEAGPGSPTGGVVRSIPGWTSSGNFTAVQYGAVEPGGAFPTPTDPGPEDRGSNFFAGGPNNASSAASQHIDVSIGAGTIDGVGATFNLSGFLGGFENQRDNAVLTAIFLSSGNAILGNAMIGPVSNSDRQNASGLLYREMTSVVPFGTRSISISLQMTRLDGAYNDAYADNLSLVLKAVPEPASMVLCEFGLSTAGIWHIRNRRRRKGEGKCPRQVKVL